MLTTWQKLCKVVSYINLFTFYSDVKTFSFFRGRDGDSKMWASLSKPKFNSCYFHCFDPNWWSESSAVLSPSVSFISVYIFVWNLQVFVMYKVKEDRIMQYFLWSNVCCHKHPCAGFCVDIVFSSFW